MIGDWFFVLVVITMSLMMGGLAIFSLLSTYTFGDVFSELEAYEDEGLAADMSKIHMVTGIMTGIMALVFITMCPAWSEYEQIPRNEYTYELKETETVFATDFDTLATDRVRWANVADQPEEYCVYKVTTYNILGRWPSEARLSLGTLPCEELDKYEVFR